MRYILFAALCCLGASVDAQQAQSPLAPFVGTFEVSSKFYMQPGQPPMQTKATAVFKEVMGGRFVRQDYKDPDMGVTGVGYLGYDPRTKRYSSVWMYNMSAKMEFSDGAMDDKGVLRLAGEGRAYEHSWPDRKTRVMKSWSVGKDGKRALLYEITYSKKE
ncbi:MAG: DUF1579 family protein [Planctomycetota bacterium]|jgi:hypothetical protein